MSENKPVVGIIMGSQSDWHVMKNAVDVLEELGVSIESRIVSAHRTPDRLYDYAKSAKDRGLKVIIAGPGVPIESKALKGMDSLLSIAQMPGGVPVGTLAIGQAGAKNAGLLAASIIALGDNNVAEALDSWRAAQTEAVTELPVD